MPDIEEKTPFFSVVIVNFNGGEFLQGAIDSLKRQTLQNFELFVVDNASSDNSMDNLDVTGMDSIYSLLEAENHGFAKANNIAASKAKGKWLVMLNPDAVADESWLEKIKDGIERFPDTKMFACAQYSLDEPSLMDGAGDCYHIFGIPWRGGYGRPVEEMPEEGECFSPCGASAVFHRQTFLDVEGFDESFFCYCEDVDLGFRLRLMGHRCIFLPQAMIHHAGSALSNKVGDFALYHGTRNRLWVFLQNMPLIALGMMLIPHLLATMAIFVVRGFEKQYLEAIYSGVVGGTKALHRRRKVQSNKKLNSFDILKQMSWKPIYLITRKADIREL